MSHLARLMLASSLAGLIGCASQLGQAGLVEGRRLDLDGPVLVMPTEDALDAADEPVRASGVQISAAARTTLTALGIEVLGGQKHGRIAAAAEAKSLGCTMILEPVVLTWYDVGHDWVRGGDKVGLSLRFWSADGRELLAWGSDERQDDSLRSGSEAAYRLVEPLTVSILERIFLGDDIVPPLDPD